MAGRAGEAHHWGMDALEIPRTDVVGGDVTSPSRWEPLPVPPADHSADLALARREAALLPVLRQGRAPHRLPETWGGVCLRLQAALWEVAARADIPLRPGVSVDAAARLLVGYGAVIPPAGDAVRALARVVDAACDGGVGDGVTVADAARVAERLAGYLALRARFG